MDENVNTHETMYAIVDIAGKQFASGVYAARDVGAARKCVDDFLSAMAEGPIHAAVVA